MGLFRFQGAAIKRGREKQKNKMDLKCRIRGTLVWQVATRTYLRFLLYIVCIVMAKLKRKGGGGKTICDKWFIWAVNMSSSTHSNRASSVCIASLVKVTEVVTSWHTQAQQVRAWKYHVGKNTWDNGSHVWVKRLEVKEQRIYLKTRIIFKV